jgi:hypothetical protein
MKKNLPIVLLVVALLFTITFFALSNMYSKKESIDYTMIKDVNEDKISGKILASLWSKKEEGGGVESYTYDFALDKFTKDNTPVKEDGPISLQSSYSPGLSMKTFIGASDEYVSKNKDKDIVPFQVFIGANDTVARMTNNNFEIKSLPSINNLGKILYAKKSTPKNINPLNIYAEHYSIQMINELGEEVYMSSGFDPKWISDNTFIFLKDDGVYMRNIEAKYSVNLLSLQDLGLDNSQRLQINSHLTVSKDGKMFAVSNLDNKSVGIYKIENIEEAKFSKVGTVEVTGFWPVFSPDSEYVAVQVADIANADVAPKPKLQIYKLSNLQKIEKEIDLDEYYQDYMFINDWIK